MLCFDLPMFWNFFIGAEQPSSSSSIATLPDVAFVNLKRYNVSLLRALHKCFWVEFYGVGVLKLIADCAGFAGPLLLNQLVSFIETKEEDIRYGYGYAAGLFVSTIIGRSLQCNVTHRKGSVGGGYNTSTYNVEGYGREF